MRLVVFFDLPVLTAAQRKSLSRIQKIPDQRRLCHDAGERLFENGS